MHDLCDTIGDILHTSMYNKYADFNLLYVLIELKFCLYDGYFIVIFCNFILSDVGITSLCNCLHGMIVYPFILNLFYYDLVVYNCLFLFGFCIFLFLNIFLYLF